MRSHSCYADLARSRRPQQAARVHQSAPPLAQRKVCSSAGERPVTWLIIWSSAGSFFASVHATLFFFRIFTSGQGFFRKIFLLLEFTYNAVQLFFTFFSVSSYCRSFS